MDAVERLWQNERGNMDTAKRGHKAKVYELEGLPLARLPNKTHKSFYFRCLRADMGTGFHTSEGSWGQC